MEDFVNMKPKMAEKNDQRNWLWSKEECELLVRMRKGGCGFDEIAKELGRSKDAVRSKCAEMGIRVNGAEWGLSMREELMRLSKECNKVSEIAERMGVSKYAVRRKMEEMGLWERHRTMCRCEYVKRRGGDGNGDGAVRRDVWDVRFFSSIRRAMEECAGCVGCVVEYSVVGRGVGGDRVQFVVRTTMDGEGKRMLVGGGFGKRCIFARLRDEVLVERSGVIDMLAGCENRVGEVLVDERRLMMMVGVDDE